MARDEQCVVHIGGKRGVRGCDCVSSQSRMGWERIGLEAKTIPEEHHARSWKRPVSRFPKFEVTARE